MPNQPPAQLMLGLAPQHAPHTRPTVCEKTSNTGYRKQANRHRLWIYSWVGQRCLAEPAQDVAEHNQIESLPLNCQSGSKSFMLFKLSKVSRTCTIRLATIRNPHRPSRKDQKGTSCLADIAQKCMVHHDAASEESTFKPSKNLLVIVLVLALCFSLLGCLLGFPLHSGFFIIVLAFWSWKLSCQQDLQHCVAPTAHYCMIFCN